jgi:hypothetical protein
MEEIRRIFPENISEMDRFTSTKKMTSPRTQLGIIDGASPRTGFDKPGRSR